MNQTKHYFCFHSKKCIVLSWIHSSHIFHHISCSYFLFLEWVYSFTACGLDWRELSGSLSLEAIKIVSHKYRTIIEFWPPNLLYSGPSAIRCALIADFSMDFFRLIQRSSANYEPLLEIKINHKIVVIGKQNRRRDECLNIFEFKCSILVNWFFFSFCNNENEINKFNWAIQW